MQSRRFTYLFEQYMEKRYTAEERKEFLQLAAQPAYHGLLEELSERYSIPENHAPMVDEQVAEEILQAILQAADGSREVRQPVHKMHFLKTAWFKYAAAILLIVTCVGVYYSVFHNSRSDNEVVQSTPPSIKKDVAPGYDRAVLTLSDGSTVELNNAASETIKDGDLVIGNENGQLRYGVSDVRAWRDPPSAATRPLPPAGDRSASRSIGFNTMSTPKGGQYKLTLADGTRVWLNAASSITYPVLFIGKTREVTITGEAYFEVTKNKAKPFIVTVASSYPPLAGVAPEAPKVDRERSERTATYKITVLGTSFNVNSYEDEATMKVSLLEGAVKVGDTNIKPGQAYQNGQVKTTNIEQDIAWKNGKFNFTGLTIQEAMRQIGRWYDVEIIYEKEMPAMRLYGGIQRNLTLSQVLKGLSVMNINYRIEGKKLILLP